MEIAKKESFEDLKNPGNYLTTKKENGEAAGIVIKCVCGDVISLSNTVHTFKSYNPLDIEPSILHKRDDKGLSDCHYFIREGKFISAQ